MLFCFRTSSQTTQSIPLIENEIDQPVIEMQVAQIIRRRDYRRAFQNYGPDLGWLRPALCIAHLFHHPFRIASGFRPEEQEEIAGIYVPVNLRFPLVARLETEHVLKILDAHEIEHLHARQNFAPISRSVRDVRQAISLCLFAHGFIDSRFGTGFRDLQFEFDMAYGNRMRADHDRSDTGAQRTIAGNLDSEPRRIGAPAPDHGLNRIGAPQSGRRQFKRKSGSSRHGFFETLHRAPFRLRIEFASHPERLVRLLSQARIDLNEDYAVARSGRRREDRAINYILLRFFFRLNIGPPRGGGNDSVSFKLKLLPVESRR